MENLKYIQTLFQKLGPTAQLSFMKKLVGDYEYKKNNIQTIFQKEIEVFMDVLQDEEKRNMYVEQCIKAAETLNEYLCYALGSSFLEFDVCDSTCRFKEDGAFELLSSSAVAYYTIDDYTTYAKISVGFDRDSFDWDTERPDFTLVTNDRKFLIYLLDNCRYIDAATDSFSHVSKNAARIMNDYARKMIHKGHDDLDVKYVSLAADAESIEQIVFLFNEYCVLNGITKVEHYV